MAAVKISILSKLFFLGFVACLPHSLTFIHDSCHYIKIYIKMPLPLPMWFFLTLTKWIIFEFAPCFKVDVTSL